MNTPRSKGPLSGVKVLDLCSVVSGPMAAVILADQGADVIKVEPPGWGDGIRQLGASRNGLSAIFAMINRNKRSIGLNLKHPEGSKLAFALSQNVDVVMQNYRPGKMDKLGLGYDDLKLGHSDLIYASISGMGEIGPYAEQRVYDYVIQGISGVTDAQSTGKPTMVRTIIYDKVTAIIAAQGITAALFAKANGAGGQHVRLSMLDAGLYFNWPDLMWNYSFQDADNQQSGDLADMYEISKTRDGYIVSHHLGADTSSYGTDEIIDLLTENGIPVAKANSRAEVMNDPQVLAMNTIEQSYHPRGGHMLMPRAPLRFEGTPTKPHLVSPEVGEHTVEILKGLGLSLDEMNSLAKEGAIG